MALSFDNFRNPEQDMHGTIVRQGHSPKPRTAIGRENLLALLRLRHGAAMECSSPPRPLIYTMPRDLWMVEIISEAAYSWRPTRIISFLRPLLPSDFARFITYDPRVKQLGGESSLILWTSLRGWDVSLEVMRAFSKFRPLPSLLPYLEHLDWISSMF
ncbi:hypothetical protein BKA93DRAFT_380912 [Sparassis latifolia]